MYGIRTKTPIGIFWDIENCAVPRNKSASDLVDEIRKQIIGAYHQELEFICTCDVTNLSSKVRQELNLAGVTLLHVDAVAKNASDEKIKERMRKFVNEHKSSQATIFLISGDVNFAPILREFRDIHFFRIILMSLPNARQELINCATIAYYDFTDFCKNIPERNGNRNGTSSNHSNFVETRSFEGKRGKKLGRIHMVGICDIPKRRINEDEFRESITERLSDFTIESFIITGNSAKLEFHNFREAREAQKSLIDFEIFPGYFLKTSLFSKDAMEAEKSINESKPVTGKRTNATERRLDSGLDSIVTVAYADARGNKARHPAIGVTQETNARQLSSVDYTVPVNDSPRRYASRKDDDLDFGCCTIM